MKHMQMIITIVCILYVTASCTTQKVAYRERLEEAKGLALYVCVCTHEQILLISTVSYQQRIIPANVLFN